MPFTIEEHVHKYVAWAAGRAASTTACRFKVATARDIIEGVGLNGLVGKPGSLPEVSDVDDKHREWRECAIGIADERGMVGFSHGVAAKLINVYLKGVFTCGGYADHERVKALHPPIDSLLLGKLWAENVGGQREIWNFAKKKCWPNFDSDDYQTVICAIRTALDGEALWKIEEYWPGHR